MYRALPEGNKILCKRWNDKNRQHHLQKLKEMKPTLQTRRYNDVFATMDRKAKRERMQEGTIHIYIYIYIYIFT